MTKTSRKTLARARKTKTRKRTDTAAACRINSEERERVLSDIQELTEPRPTIGAYAKHALLSHGRLRRMEVDLKQIVYAAINDLSDSDAAPSQLLERMQQVLERTP